MKVTFFHPVSLVVRGHQRPLQAADLWPLRDQDSSFRIMTDLEKCWTQHSKKNQYDTLHLILCLTCI